MRKPKRPPDLEVSIVSRTELEAANQELRRTKARLDFLVSNSPAVIHSCAPDPPFRATYVSPNVVAQWGYKPQDFTDRPGFWAEKIHPDDAPRVLAELSRLFDVDQRSYEYRFRVGDGGYRWMHDQQRVVRNDQGEAIEIVGAVSDITDRKAAELALRKSEDSLAATLRSIGHAERELRRLNQELEDRVRARTAELEAANSLLFAAIEATVDGILVVDRGDNRVTVYNQRFLELFRMPASEIAERDGDRVLRWALEQLAEPEAFYQTIMDLRANPDVASHGVLKLKDGRVLERHYLPQRIGERIAGRVHGFRDVTERQEAEAALRLTLREKETLLKEVHHRVKNNLQIIASLLAMQSDTTTDASTQELLKESIHRVRSMALIHERLYQSRSLARIDFGEYAQDLTESLCRSYRTTSAVRLDVQVDACEINAETAMPCGLILNELVSNALKHAFGKTDAGELLVAVKSEPAGGFSLTVRDNGPGLPPGLDLANTSSLGMQLVVSLTKQIKGELLAKNDGGAHFRVKFKELTYAAR